MNAQSISSHDWPIRLRMARRLSARVASIPSSASRTPPFWPVVTALAVICVTVLASGPATAANRIVLLLGVEAYQNFPQSPVGAADIQALGKALEQQGFEVAVAANPVNAAARAALSEFSRKAQAAEFALIVAGGHFATYRGQSFYLPANVRVRRATDLLSQSLSVAGLAELAATAKAGAVAMIVSVPDIPSTVAGVSARPDLAATLPPNVVVSFSTSDKVPVSSVGKISQQAIAAMIAAAAKKPLMLSALIGSASALGTGRVFGKVQDRNLSQDAAHGAGQSASPDGETVAQAAERAAREAEAEAARKATELAEARRRVDQRLSDAEQRARLAEQRAREAETAAQRQLAAAQAAQAAAAAAEKAASTTAAPAASQPRTSDLGSLKVVEALIGREQLRTIQRVLKALGHYDGPLDAIFGDQTRAAIKSFQKQGGEAESGYLTPEQFQKLVAKR